MADDTGNHANHNHSSKIAAMMQVIKKDKTIHPVV